jgi:hypothetical protein
VKLIDPLQHLPLLALLDEDHLLLLVVGEEAVDEFPDFADACGVVEEGAFGESAVVGAHLLDDGVEVEVGDGGEGDVVEVDDEHELLGVVGHHLEGLDDQHQVVDRVEGLLQRLLEVHPVDAHHQHRQQLTVVPVAVDRPHSQPQHRLLVQPGYHLVTVERNHLLNALDCLLAAPLRSVDVLQDQLVVHAASTPQYCSVICSWSISALTYLILSSSSSSKPTL